VLTISILAGGRSKTAPEHALALDYLAKARDHGRSLGFAGFALTEADDRKLGPALAQSEHPILLDETGKARSSRDFAQWLATLRDQGLPATTFVIGGADGFTAQDRAQAKGFIAFGPQTWPHMLVRPMLAEQLYRAMTILSGHPYHRDGAR
jgi:23S rRNA (pseudouridine1915-N3)-methyltransferase